MLLCHSYSSLFFKTGAGGGGGFFLLEVLKQNSVFAAVTITSASAFKVVGPKARALSTDA